MEVIPLGTASALPTRERHLAAVALLRQGRVLLFDCGEGTQFQLLRAGLKRSALDAVFITHLHGDHFYGLMGLLSTVALLGREASLTLVGPAGLAGIVQSMPGMAHDEPPFRLDYVELDEGFAHGVVFETTACTVEARPLDHRVFTLGYRFQEKTRPGRLDAAHARTLGVTDYRHFRRLKAGQAVTLGDGRVVRTRPGRLDAARARTLGVTDYRHFRRLKAGQAVTLGDGRVVRPEAVVGPERPGVAFAYVSDTRPCAAGVALAAGADLLYHEATFGDDLAERAAETGHATARQAAEVARRAGAARLLLGHFSARYKDPAPLVEQARAVFQNTEAAEELKRYKIFAAEPQKF